MILSTNTKPD